MIWDNAPAHRGPAMRSYLETPDLNPRLTNLPGYSPDFNADEAVWGWARREAPGNQCLETKALVQQRVNQFLAGLASRKDEVRRRRRTVLLCRKTGAGGSSPANLAGRCSCRYRRNRTRSNGGVETSLPHSNAIRP